MIDDSWYVKPPEPCVRRISAGGVVVRVDQAKPLVALARETRYDEPVLPKGGVEPGESFQQAARREVEEEAGLSSLSFVAKLGVLERLSFDRQRWVTTHFYLFTTEQVTGIPTDRERHPHGPIWRRLDQLDEMFWPDQRKLILTHSRLIESCWRCAQGRAADAGPRLNPDEIGFRSMRVADLPLLRRWRTESAEVRRWYAKNHQETFETMQAKYLPRINGDVPTRPFLILMRETPIGYIQTYRIADYPEYARCLQISEEAAGLDLFIGEDEFLHRGLGAAILKRFLGLHVFGASEVASCIVGPEPNNKAAIRAYEKAGFQYLKTVKQPDEDEPEYLMRVSRDALS